MTQTSALPRKTKFAVFLGAVFAALVALTFVATGANAAAGQASTAATGVNCGVTDTPEAIAELQARRADFFEARQAWFDQYGTDRWSDEAQAALQELRDDHEAKVQAVLDEYGIDATAGSQSRSGYSHGTGGGMGGMGAGPHATT